MTYIAEIKDIPYDKKRADVVLSDGEICRAFKATIKEYGLVEGKNIDFAELKRIAKEGEEHIAFTTAIDSLSRGIKSQNEVRKNLKTKKFSDDAVDVTIEKLLSYNYLGDRAYAEAYVSYKGQKTGRRKIIYELITIKGIDKNVAQEVAYAKLSDEEEIEKAISMAQKYIEKEKKKRTRLKERAYCFLATRGFDTDIISSAMNSLDFSEEE